MTDFLTKFQISIQIKRKNGQSIFFKLKDMRSKKEIQLQQKKQEQNISKKNSGNNSIKNPEQFSENRTSNPNLQTSFSQLLSPTMVEINKIIKDFMKDEAQINCKTPQIFQQQVHKEWKNRRNLPKFLLKILMKEVFTQIQQNLRKKQFQGIKRILEEQQYQNGKLIYLSQLLYNSTFQRQNRRDFLRLLHNQKVIQTYIFNNPYIGKRDSLISKQSKLEYLKGLKIFMFRLRSKDLSTRLEIN